MVFLSFLTAGGGLRGIWVVVKWVGRWWSRTLDDASTDPFFSLSRGGPRPSLIPPQRSLNWRMGVKVLRWGREVSDPVAEVKTKPLLPVPERLSSPSFLATNSGHSPFPHDRREEGKRSRTWGTLGGGKPQRGRNNDSGPGSRVVVGVSTLAVTAATALHPLGPRGVWVARGGPGASVGSARGARGPRGRRWRGGARAEARGARHGPASRKIVGGRNRR